MRARPLVSQYRMCGTSSLFNASRCWAREPRGPASWTSGIAPTVAVGCPLRETGYHPRVSLEGSAPVHQRFIFGRACEGVVRVLCRGLSVPACPHADTSRFALLARQPGMSGSANPGRRWLTAAVLSHLVVSIVHGAAHNGAQVPLSPAANLFVFTVILAGHAA